MKNNPKSKAAPRLGGEQPLSGHPFPSQLCLGLAKEPKLPGPHRAHSSAQTPTSSGHPPHPPTFTSFNRLFLGSKGNIRRTGDAGKTGSWRSFCGWKGKKFINFSWPRLGREQLRIHHVSGDLDVASIRPRLPPLESVSPPSAEHQPALLPTGDGEHPGVGASAGGGTHRQGAGREQPKSPRRCLRAPGWRNYLPQQEERPNSSRGTICMTAKGRRAPRARWRAARQSQERTGDASPCPQTPTPSPKGKIKIEARPARQTLRKHGCLVPTRVASPFLGCFA